MEVIQVVELKANPGWINEDTYRLNRAVRELNSVGRERIGKTSVDPGAFSWSPRDHGIRRERPTEHARNYQASLVGYKTLESGGRCSR